MARFLKILVLVIQAASCFGFERGADAVHQESAQARLTEVQHCLTFNFQPLVCVICSFGTRSIFSFQLGNLQTEEALQ